jgi:hypothetical protein
MARAVYLLQPPAKEGRDEPNEKASHAARHTFLPHLCTMKHRRSIACTTAAVPSTAGQLVTSERGVAGDPWLSYMLDLCHILHSVSHWPVLDFIVNLCPRWRRPLPPPARSPSNPCPPCPPACSPSLFPSKASPPCPPACSASNPSPPCPPATAHPLFCPPPLLTHPKSHITTCSSCTATNTFQLGLIVTLRPPSHQQANQRMDVTGTL